MYLEHYGLTCYPFGITPDPEFLYLSPCHKQAMAALIYGIRERQGFISIIGEVGCGKTLMLRSYLKRADRSRMRFVYVFDPDLEFEPLLQQILADLGVRRPHGSTEPAMRTLHRCLIEIYRRNELVVVIIDEAQRMPVETLERLRLLSNLETSRTKLLQIVLSGQPELEDTLRRHDLRQLRQRIAIRANLRPLNKEESVAYLAHRISVAGGDMNRMLSKGAVGALCRYGKGRPRYLNVLANEALITGYAKNEYPLTAATVREAYRDREGAPRLRSRRTAALLCVGLAVLFSAILATRFTEGYGWSWLDSQQRSVEKNVENVQVENLSASDVDPNE